MAPVERPEPGGAGRAVADEIGFARRLLRRVGGRLTIAFVAIALSLWTFGELAEDVLEGEPFGFDAPLLELARAASAPSVDRAFLFLSAVGFAWGVIPADVALIVGLALRRRFAESTFSLIATAGSGLINVAAKRAFQRERPALWDSIAPEATYSFPSGHAMGSATLACVLVMLAWRTRWRWSVLAAAAAFVAGVGLSRVYLGVHYPSDILAGWTAAIAWTVVCYFAVFRAGRRPWQPRPVIPRASRPPPARS